MSIEHITVSIDSGGKRVDIAMYNNGGIIEQSCPDAGDTYSKRVFLCKDRGMKLNYIRVLYMFCCLGFFTDKNGQRAIYKDVFNDFGRVVGEDLSDYNNHLSRSLSDSTSLEKHLKIFRDMEEKMKELFNSK